MITRTIARPAALPDDSLLADCPVRGVRIAPGDGGAFVITAPDEAAADAAEIWLAEMEMPGH